MIEKLRNNDFDKMFQIMELSFPSDEFRPYGEQKALLDKPNYTIYALYDESDNIKAFISVWDFDDFAFIEHFAVNPSNRNEGIGGYMLGEIFKMFDKTLCLEVELPKNEISKRRIGFYQRNNFHLNDYPYIQPSISKGKNPIPLLIMTSKNKIEKSIFENIKTTLYANVYECI